MAKVFPRLHHGTGLWFVQGLQFVAQFTELVGTLEWVNFSLGMGRLCLYGLGAFLTGIGHAIKRALAAATADSKIHGPINAVDGGVGHAQFGAGDKFLTLGGIGRSIGSQVHGRHGAIGPVQAIDGLLILGREFGSQTGGDSHRGTRANPVGTRQAVRIPLRPFAGAGTPAKVSTTGHMVEARGAVPWCACVPFHVRVIGKEFSVYVECHVIGIPESHSEGFPVFTILIKAGNPSAWRPNVGGVAAGIR